jgi:hypothetical protein
MQPLGVHPMKKLVTYAATVLIMSGLDLSRLATQKLPSETKRQMAITKDNHGASHHRGVGAPLIEEFENQIH